MKYLSTAIASAFGYLSPMIRMRFRGSTIFNDKVDKSLLNQNVDHFTSIKLALDVIQDVRLKKELREEFLPQIVSEINELHKKCDQLISFKFAKAGKPLTFITMFYICSFFTMNAVRKLQMKSKV